MKYYVDFIPIGAVIGTMILTWLVTAISANIRWRRIARHHLPDMAKSEIEKLEEENRELKEQIENYKKESESDRARLRAVRAAVKQS